MTHKSCWSEYIQKYSKLDAAAAEASLTPVSIPSIPAAKYQTPLVVAPRVFAPINAPLVRYESPKVFTRADSIIPATYYSGYNAYPNTYPINTYPYSYHNAAYPYYAGFHGMPVVTAPIVSKSAKEAVEAEE